MNLEKTEEKISIKSRSNSYNKEEENIIENEDELNATYGGEGVYPMNGIKVEKGFYTVFELKRKYDSKDKKIILDSDLQRDDVWKKNQKCELIESVLMGLPLPIFYFNEDKNARLIVIDGRQRLTALFEFMSGNFSLGKLKIMRNFNNKNFSQLDPIFQSKIEDYQIVANVIQPPTPDRIKFDIFDRVNRSGTQLNKQEIRNALYQGNATDVLKAISSCEYFNLATGGVFNKEKRMKDKYIILRFLAFYLHLNNKIYDGDEQYQYKNDIDDLLGKTMEYMNKRSKTECSKLIDESKYALSNSYFYLGKDAFRLLTGKKRSPINMNIFETIMFAMAITPLKDEKRKHIIYNAIEKMKNSDEFRDSINNHRDSEGKINKRFEMAKKINEGV
ncbi:MAG: DUF262 domain-containing protein [Clostridia bacterium]|nr:DUF262 domain-containing protein [Clostridia bacterium]MDD4387111.1 DUF262 domain-containing protein [Clostridia bacterium]